MFVKYTNTMIDEWMNSLLNPNEISPGNRRPIHQKALVVR